MNYALMQDVGRATHAEMVRRGERAALLLRSQRVAQMPTILKGLLLLLS